MFGAVFMITDPVTTPTSPVGNCVVGVIAALLTVLTSVHCGKDNTRDTLEENYKFFKYSALS